MTLSGTIRSTEEWTGHGSGLTAGEAYQHAIADVPAGYQLLDAITESARPGEPVTMRSSARSLETRSISADGVDYANAVGALRDAVPAGWQLQGFVIDSL